MKNNAIIKKIVAVILIVTLYFSSYTIFYNVEAIAEVEYIQTANTDTDMLGLDKNGDIYSGKFNSSQNKISVASNTKFNYIAMTETTNYALDRNGYFWAWGSNSNGQFGNGNKSSDKTTIPEKTINNIRFKKISVGWQDNVGQDSVYGIDMNGNIWRWGAGTSSFDLQQTTPIQITSSRVYNDIAVGGSHVLAIDSSGKLYARGENTYGQLGNNSTVDSSEFIAIMPSKMFSQIATGGTGGDSSMAVDTSGNLYVWGRNNSVLDPMLVDTSANKILEPYLVKNGISKVYSTHNDATYYAIDKNGDVWANNFSFGHGYHLYSHYMTPTDNIGKIGKIMEGANIKNLSCGKRNHLMLIDNNGITYSLSGGYIFYQETSKNGYYVVQFQDTMKSQNKIMSVKAGQNAVPPQNIASNCVQNTYEYKIEKYTNITGDKVIEPTPKSYSVTLEPNGGRINSGNVTSHTFGTDTILPTNVTKTGYTFAGWYNNEGLTGSAVNKILGSQTGNKTYYAKWTQNKYTVTFKNENEVVNTQEVAHGESATAPTAPTKQGYTFAGWDKDFSNVTSNLTVNAKWTASNKTQYTVEQYRQNSTLDDYDLIGSDIYEGTTGEKITVGTTGIEGFFVDENNTMNKLSGVITADGSLVLKVYYDRATYEVTLNTNRGTIPEGENVISYTYGVGATLPTPVKQGYTFAGWYINEDLTGESIHTIGALATGDKTYFAKWEAGEGTAYTVEYYKENLQGTYDRVEADTQHLTGTTGQSVTVTPKTYEGFTAKEDNILTGIIAADGSLVIKVYYDRNTYTITYEPNYSTPGGVVNPETVMREFKYGESVQIDNIHVTRTGYNFIGWNTETIGNGINYQVGDTYSKNESTTLYAQWRANTYNVTLNTNEGTIPEEENVTRYTYGVGATLPTPVRQGYTFAGWYTNAELEGNNVAQITETDIGDKEYFAKWEEGTGTAYKVEHYKQNLTTNTYEKVATDDLTAKTGLTVTAISKTYEGFHENTTHGDRVASGVVSVDGSLVLKLYYDINQYTVTFKNEDTVLKEETVAHGQAAVAPEIPTRAGYTFTGWDKDFSNVTSNLEVKAIWTVSTYKVTLNTNGGTITEGENVTNYTYGVGATLPTPTREGYTFAGWYRTEDLTGDAITNIGTLATGDKTYYAKWNKNQYTVTFVSDGQILSTQNIAHGQAAVAPTAPTKKGYTFAGWDKDFTNVTSNLEVKAIWTKNQEEPKQVGYKVEHYKQNTKTNTYEKVATEELTGTTGSTVTAVAKTYEGFHENTIHGDRVASGVVSADGSLVLKLYYDINKYTVTFKDGDQVVKTETVEHGGNATPPTITKPGYILSWDKGTDNVTGDATFTAVWTKDPNYVDPNANKNDGKEEKPNFLPQTGESYIVVGMISVVMSVAVLVYLKYRKIGE